MANAPAYIAGVGLAYLDGSPSENAIHKLAVSTGIKALLDAGITFDYVDHSISCFTEDAKIPKSCFASYGKTGSPVSELDCISGVHAASQLVASGRTNCVMVIGLDKQRDGDSNKSQIAVVSLILVSEAFLTHHAYLKDSSTLIRGSKLVTPIHSQSDSDSETLATKAAVKKSLQQAELTPDDIQVILLQHGSNSKLQKALGDLKISKDGQASSVSPPFLGTTGLVGLCHLVWQLRGWVNNGSMPAATNCLQYTNSSDGTAGVFILSRVNGQPVPKWEDIEHLRDGRERVGHNPAIESKDVSHEDWLAVKSRDEYVPRKTADGLQLPVKGGDRAALARL